MKTLYVALFLILGLLFVDAYYLLHTPPNTPYSLKAKGYHGIVRLVHDDKTYCSGSVISDTTVITAGHCVAVEVPFVGIMLNKDPIEIRPENNDDLGTTGKVLSMSPQLDQAVITGDFRQYGKLKYLDDISSINGLMNTNYVACGYPMGGDLYCTSMTYDSLRGFMWSVSGLLLPGMSGGPVLTPNGVQIAINDAVYEDHSIISPLYNIHIEFPSK